MQDRKRCEVKEKLLRLQKVLAGKRQLLIVLQDFPDPDALGAAAALRELARSVCESTTTLACAGFVGRAENRELLRYLGLNVQPLQQLSLEPFDCIAMVDTQPGAGNNGLPDTHVPDIVIDHHPIRGTTRKSPFFDVRKRYGSTSTILYEYLMEAEVDIPIPVATSLLYGIRSDTNDLGREAIQADIDAFLGLYPAANKRILGRIGMARVPRAYFQVMLKALKKADSHGECIFSDLGEVDNPDMVSEMADLLLRDEETSWAMCFAVYCGEILISLRTSDLKVDAGKVMRRIVGRLGTGGGHSVMAGGQILLASKTRKEIQSVKELIVARFLRSLGATSEPSRRLVRP